MAHHGSICGLIKRSAKHVMTIRETTQTYDAHLMGKVVYGQLGAEGNIDQPLYVIVMLASMAQ